MSGGTLAQPCVARAEPATDSRAKRIFCSLFLMPEHPLRSVAVFLAILVVLAIRSRDALLLPIMAFEDGRDMLAFFFNNPSIKGVFHLYNGYVSFIPKLAAWASVGLLPLPAVPYAFGFASLTIVSLSFYLLTRPGHSWLIPGSNSRAILGLTLALFPLAKDFLVTNLTYSQWTILSMLLLLVTRRPIPSSTSGLSWWTLCVAACAASHPLSILTLPLLLVALPCRADRRQKLAIAILVCVLLLYQLFGVDHHAVSLNLSLGSVGYAIEVFLARVAFETFFGARATNLLITNGQTAYVCALGVALLLAVVCLTLSERKLARGLSIASTALWFSFSIVLLSVLTRYNTPATKSIYLQEPALQRYFYVPKIITIVICAWLLIPRIQSSLTTGRWPRFRAGMAVFIFATYLFAVIHANLWLYGCPRAEGLRVKAFLASTYSDLSNCKKGAPYESLHVLQRQWADVVLDLDRRAGKSTMKGTDNADATTNQPAH